MTQAASPICPIGIGLRQPHYKQLFETRPELGFLEVHSENFFAAGGAAAAVLTQARQHYPISLHGVGLGLGSAAGLDAWHVAQLKELVARTQPMLVSDHACFARAAYPYSRPVGTVHGNDLLPIRFTHASLEILCSNVAQVQDALGRSIAVENLSAYVAWGGADMSEVDFLNAMTQRTGCGLLLDVNNLYVNACNTLPHGTTAQRITQAAQFIAAVRQGSVMEIHVAGFTQTDGLIIDDHASPVHPPVWDLLSIAHQRFPNTPTLVEWDLELPTFDVLLGEAARARQLLRTEAPHAR